MITDLRKSHTAADFFAFLNKIEREVPAELDVHVILDNLSTHKTPPARSGCCDTGGSTSTSPRPTVLMNLRTLFSALTTRSPTLRATQLATPRNSATAPQSKITNPSHIVM